MTKGPLHFARLRFEPGVSILYGVNGAGKTTLLTSCLTFVAPAQPNKASYTANGVVYHAFCGSLALPQC